MGDTKNSNPAVERLTAMRDEVRDRLAENADYRTLIALNRAIADITGEGFDPQIIEPKGSKKPVYKADTVDVRGMSQADAAHSLLTNVMHEPVFVANLVKALTAHGINVGGTNPNINLSSVLSKDGRFRSVRYKDRACWWVKGTPFPGELDTQ